MPVGFNAVPDWFSSNNQGGGIAVTSLSNTMELDIFVLLVDSPIGQNQGMYKVGKRVDADGIPTGGWGEWQQIPDWFSSNNQGAGIALADLSGSGRPDLIVFLIDSPLGKNRGLYQVGKELDQDGIVTGGWTGWKEVPDWFSGENNGGSIAVTDIDGDGNHELIVFMIDAPVGPNRGLYKIGRKLRSDGEVQGGWTDWQTVPEWFAWDNQGAGVAVNRPNNDRQCDLIFFQIDNALTQNQAFFKIASDIGADGTVKGGWSPWYGVPGWFSWENQGGAIAVAPLRGPGTHDLLVLNIDSPPGQNAGLYRVVSLDNDPVKQGAWELLPYDSQVLAVHAAALPDGKVLFFAGSGNSGVRFADPNFGNTALEFWCSVVWDYRTSRSTGVPQFSHPDTLRSADGRPIDFFCGGESLLADGRPLVAGGTLEYDVDGQNRPVGHRFKGRRDALTFDLTTQQWTVVAPMAHGRWYPTLITLGDGRVLAASGLDEKGGLNREIEIYTPDGAQGQWDKIAGAPPLTFFGFPTYAHLFQIADGRLFFTGGRMDDINPGSPCLMDITQAPVKIMPVSGLQAAISRNQSASVLLPPAQDQRFLIMGGALPIGEEYATDSVNVIDLKNASDPLPSYEPAASLLLPRVHLNAVLLPDRTVFVTGGALDREGGKERRILARYQSEIYDPATDSWHLAGISQIARMYHSVALLMEDGRVICASGNPDKGSQVKWEPADPNEELRIEVYSPPYLFKGPRPQILRAPDNCGYDTDIEIDISNPADIRWAHLVRNGVTTHSFNTTQRLVDLPVVTRMADKLIVHVPLETNIAPPGYYMLFVVDNEGIPSVAHWIKLG